MGETELERAIRKRQQDKRSAVGRELRRVLDDERISLRALAAAVGIDVSHLSRVVSGSGALSQDALVAVATALGYHASIKLFPTDGPRIRDHLQARMLEVVIAALHARWIARLEVPVWRPTRGVIDLLLQDRLTGDLVAGEGHSRLATVEGQLRHAHEKADALPSAAGWPWSDRLDEPRVSRLLVLRSCRANHDLVNTLPLTFATAYPGDTRQAVAALRDRAAPFPDEAIVWVHIDGSRSRLLDGVPRGVRTHWHS